MKFIRVFCLSFFISASIAKAEITGSGWFQSSIETNVTVEEIEFSQAKGNPPPEQPQAFLASPEIAEAITPEIEALARGLENDPKRIFDYVHDRIRYVHYFGSKKGAQLTLLEQSGNDFDQCALFVALLRSAGHTANYQFGMTELPYEKTNQVDFRHWVGATKPNTNWNETTIFVASLNSSRGFPYTAIIGGNTNDLFFHRVWVNATCNGTNYLLDPAFKVSEPISGINLATAMGLSTNDVMTAAGGTSTADYTQTLNETNLRNKLRDYTTNFLSYVGSNSPNATVEDIVGGQRIISSTAQPLDQGLPFTIYTNGGAWPIQEWDNIPTNFMATLSLTIDGTNQLLFLPELRGNKLALTFSTSGLAQLWLEDELLLQKQTSGGATVSVTSKIDHPHGTWDFTNQTLTITNWNDHTALTTYQRTNASYVLMYGFEPDEKWLRQRQERLNELRQQGWADSSRQVLTETLHVMGLSWLVQNQKAFQVVAAQQDILIQYHHRFGRMAQEAGQGYYIDAYQVLNGLFPASGYSAGDLTRRERIFAVNNYFGSALEHAMIEQMQSSNLVAASTVKMLQVANANNQRIFLAKSNNWASVRTQLTNYHTLFLDDLGVFAVSSNYTFLIPQNGLNYVAGTGSWRGFGMVGRGSSGDYNAMSMMIAGLYNGGYAALPNVGVNPRWAAGSDILPRSLLTGIQPTEQHVGDPVNIVDGSFIVGATDLSLGGAEPRGITLARHYTSARRHYNLAGLGHGWVHNYHFNLAEVSAPLPGLGATTPAQMASMIIATKSAFELYDPNGSAKNWAVTALIAKWGLDQLIKNAVSVSMGNDTVQFIKQPNGTYTAPAGSTMTLTNISGTTYNLLERHGNTFKFNSSGRLTNIVDQYAKGLTLTYNASNWVTKVTDWKGRELNFTYSGTPSRLASVADSSRTVSYGYTTNSGQLDLTSITDPESKTSTFLYDTNHQILSVKNALNQIVTTNLYDGFGRVIEQYTQGDTNQMWRFYYSGFINTEQDPAGSKRRFFYDDKSRFIRLQDALGNLSQTFYDGQNHVVKTISPMNETNRFEFDRRHNLLRTIDALNFTNQFVYDAQDNLVQAVDARGGTSSFGYNAKFQLTGSTNAAGNWKTFAYHATEGTLTSQSDAGGTISFSYDTRGQLNGITYPGSLGSEGFLNSTNGSVLNHTNARGFVTSFQYNLRRELTNTIAPTNLTAKISFDAAGNVVGATDARGFSTTNLWSATRKLLSTTLPATPQGIPVVTNIYDQRDWLIQTLNPQLSALNYTNDAAGRLIAMTDPLQRTTRFGYDVNGRKTSTTNAANEVTRQTWNQRSEPIQTTDGAGNSSRRAYDANGNQITLTNRNGKKWQFQFDAANRLTNTITPLGRSTSQTYNNRGLLSSLKEPSAQTATLSYDARGRLTNRTDIVGTTVFRYDANNNQTNIVENGKTNAWTFDAYDRVSTYKDTDGNLIQYRYDQNHNLTNLVYPDGKIVKYFYDSLNRLTNVTDWASRQTSMEYDLANRLKKVTRLNGTVRELFYDAAGQTTNIIERMGIGVPIALFKLNWNAAARMEWEFAAPLPKPYTPPTRTMTYNDDNQIATFNGNSVTHDSDGNMTSGPGTNSTFGTYTYDVRNRLLGMTSTTSLTYSYDALNNRTSITNGTNITRFVINPNAALSQTLIRVKNGMTNYYVYGVGLLYEADASENIRTYHYDYRGSTVAITDNSGIVTDRIEYSAYGTTTHRTGTTDTPFLFNGRFGVMTDANGLLHMRARYYNPFLCRFINADPAGFAGGLNFYAYADGNPISMIDPFGLGADEPHGFSWLLTNVGKTIAGFGKFIVDRLIGENFGKAWLNLRSAFQQTSYHDVPNQLGQAGSGGLDSQINDNKYGHSLQASGLQVKLGLIGAPLIAAGGVLYELFHFGVPGHVQGQSSSYTRPAPFFGFADGQNPLNWLYDTPGDLLGNTIGQFTGIFTPNPVEANRITFLIPGPNYSQQRFEALGRPENFWTRLAPPGASNPWNNQ